MDEGIGDVDANFPENADDGKRSRRNTKRVSYAETRIPEVDSDDEDDKRRSYGSKVGQRSKGRTKECPGCSASLPTATKECAFCDYQFSSKSMLVTQAMMLEESDMIRDRFPFEAEREEDGSLIIQNILGRRPRKTGRRWTRSGSSLFSASDAKFDYEYLIKFKGMSYMHVQWLSATDIDAMNPASKKSLMRYLNRLDKGDPDAPEEADIDPTWTEIEKILDVREEEVSEVIDQEAPPPVAEVSAQPEILEHRTRLGNKQHSSEQLQKVEGGTAAPTAAGTTITMQGDTLVKTESSSNLQTSDSIEELTGLAKWQAENQRQSTKIWNPLERAKRLLDRICEDPYSLSFYDPVDTEEYDDYLDVIETPMCLSDMQGKLERGEYRGFNFLHKFMTDLRLIWKNCKAYNLYKSQIWHNAHVLAMMTERLYQSWLIVFQDGLIPMTESVARPWEPCCRACLRDDNEDKVILCDHCDAQYHIFCLKPPLKKVPDGIWICAHCTNWLERTGSRFLSATAEDEARQMAENAGQRVVILVKKKKYLVKWRGLSFKDCTWETAVDIDDDQMIANYHAINDAPPEEPPLTQAEIGFELSKERKFQIYPAFAAPNRLIDLQSNVYSQIRTMHFLKWNTVAPVALLKESGRSACSFTYGARVPLALPANIREALGQQPDATQKGSANIDAMEVDGGESVCNLPQRNLKSLDWFVPTETDYIRNEVSNVLSTIVYNIAQNNFKIPMGNRPQVLSFEIELCLPKGNGGLHINMGNIDNRPIVMGFRPQPNGLKGYAEASGRIRPGDILIGVNEDYINHLPFREVVARLAGIKHPFVFLRFLRTPPHDRYRYDHHYLGDRISAVVPKRPILMRSKYFGVYNLGNGKFSAEVIHNFSVLKAGVFASELEAAVAYDELNERVNGNEVMRNFLALGPGVEPYTLTPEARGLAANVAYENLMNTKRREKLALSTTASMLPKKANDDDLCSLDSLDSDSELESDHEQQQEQNDSSSGSDDSDSEIEDKKLDRVSSLFAAEGQISRLMRAVNECDFSPKVADWENYILELAIASANEDAKVKRVEQLDLAGNSMRTWKNAAEAYRGTGIPAHVILFCLSGKSDEAGGYKWRYTAPADKKLADDEEKEEEVKEDAWIAKLPVVTKEYKSGGTLRDYQLEGLRWLLRCWYQKRSSILADEMGLGKTVQVVSFLDHLFEVENIKGPFLVCVPLSTLEHWKREAEGWSHMSVCMYHDAGGGKDMRDAIREFEWYYKGRSRRLLKFHLLITTYDDLIKDYEDMAEIPWRAVIVDEAHRLKNINSKLLECVRSVVAKGQIAYGYQHRVLMTGTPLQNNTAELWSLLNFIEPAKFPDAESFSKRYGTITTQEQVESLQKRIAPHLLRRVKEDVAKDIPAKEETIIDVELTMAQKTYYRAIFERNHSFLMQSTKGGLPKLMNIQMELRKCCNHPFLISGVEDTVLDNLQSELLDHEAIPVDGQTRAEANSLVKKEYLRRRMDESLIPMSGKMVLLDKLLPKLRREGHKVLIFSQMVRMIDLIEEFAEIRSYPCERLDGKVRGNDRQKCIDRYNTQVDSFLFLLSTRAGGVGINLTAADTVIIFDSDWNPQNDVQAMARCHRIGQKKQVTVYRLITRRSFEAEMFHRASRKLGLEQAVLGSRDFNADEVEDQQKVKIDAKEMEQLLREGAYSVLLEDDADDMNAFIAQDIDTILDQRAHIIVTEGGKPTESWLNKQQQDKSKKKPRAKKSTFTANGESSSEYVDIDLNDPDFWKKVLPDLVTPEMMLQRLIGFKEIDTSPTDRTAFCTKFMKDMSQMMNGILDLQRRGHLPENEKATCATLLLRLTMKEELLSKTQLNEAKIWLSVIEGNRKRATRVAVDSPDRPQGGRGRGGRGRGGGRGGGGRGAAKKNIEPLDDEDDDADDADDEKPLNKRGGSRAKSTRTRGRPEAVLNESAASGSKRRGSAGKKVANEDETDDLDDDDENGRFSSSPAKKKRKSGSVSSASAAILLQQQILRGAVDTSNNDDDDDISAVDEDGGVDPYSSTFL